MAAARRRRSDGHRSLQAEPVANRVDEALLFVQVLARVGDDAVGRQDADALGLVFDLDQAVGLQRAECVLDGVDVGLDRGPDLEHGHPVVGPVHERVEYRDLDVGAIPVLPLCSHSPHNDRSRFTVTARADGPRRSVVRPGVRRASDAEGVFFWCPVRNLVAMGLRCLLGHDYGDPELERDRDEQGEEVVVTIREVATCTRCGAERVVSENKEVTSIASPSEIEGLAEDDAHDATVVDADGVSMGADDDAATAADASADAAAPAETSASPDTPAPSPDADAPEPTDADADAPAGDAEGGAEIIEETADEEHTPTAEEVEPPVAEADADAADDGPSAEEDDGVILDADDEEPTERGHGEWPDADDVNDGPPEKTPTIEEVRGEDGAGAASPAGVDDAQSEGDTQRDAEVVSETEADRTQWPEQVGDDEGFDAEPSDGSASEVEFGGIAPDGDSPEDVQEVEEGFDAEFVDNGSEASRAANGTITRATEIDTSRDSQDVPTEYVCPECGLRRPASGSSMREGDICPECKRGYIAEEPR